MIAPRLRLGAPQLTRPSHFLFPALHPSLRYVQKRPQPRPCYSSSRSVQEESDVVRLEASCPWATDEALLHYIFQLPHLFPSLPRDANACKQLSNLYAEFVEALQEVKGGESPLWPSLSVKEILALRKAAQLVCSPSVVWLASFGCAVIHLEGSLDACPGLTQGSVFVIGLDEFAFDPLSMPDGSATYPAKPQSSAVLFSGHVPANSFPDLINAMHSMVDKRKKEAKTEKGFQRTPAFIQAVLQDALEELSNPSSPGEQAQKGKWTMPAGGFTDVGPHTGNTPPCTPWPLTAQVLKVVLEQTVLCRSSLISSETGEEVVDASSLHTLAMAHFELQLLSVQAHLVSPATCVPVVINACMKMLQSSCRKAADLAAEGFNMGPYETACKRVEQHLGAMSASRARMLAQQFQLPAGASLKAELSGHRQPLGVVPSTPPPVSGDGGLQAASERAADNLGTLPELPPGVGLASLLTWLNLPYLEDVQSTCTLALLRLRTVERELFSRAASGFQPMLLDEVVLLENIVESYRQIHHKFLQTPASKACMQTEMRSRLVLVVWSFFCFQHASTVHTHPVLAEYGVGLRWTDLKHLVLSDRASVDAALNIAAYLSACTKPGMEVFCVREGDTGRATFHLAYRYASGDKAFMDIWEDHQHDASIKQNAYWAEVKKKQCLALSLRQQLTQANSSLRSAGDKLASARSQLSASSWRTDKYKRAQQEESRCHAQFLDAQSVHSTLQKQLSEAEKPPPPMLMPVPSTKSAALAWIFHMHMPPMFVKLSRASFLAQQLLLPNPEHAQGLDTSAPNFKTHLLNHYNQQQQDKRYHSAPKIHLGSTGCVELHSLESVPRSPGPDHIDAINSSYNGIWYPDSLLPHLAWKGSASSADKAQHIGTLSSNAYFNPFGNVPDLSLTVTFTEKLPHPAEHLQWVMPLPSSIAPDRGNKAIANLNQRPDWLSKPGFLDFASLRAFPHIQLRRLCAILHERTLPLASPAVCTLIKQSLMHIGTLSKSSGSSSPGLLWRTDWMAAGNVGDALHHELRTLADELENAPREHQAVLLLGEVASYLADWHPGCREAALQFASMTSRSADSLDQQVMDVSGNDAVQQDLQAKQCELRMISLLCYGAGPLGTPEVASMLRLMVLICHGHTFLDDPSTRQRLASLRIRCLDVMCRHARCAVHHAAQHPHILTAAVGSVLQRIPASLDWHQLQESGFGTGSYEAVSGDGHLFSINTLDGTILLDGRPPSRLPKGILGHRMYKRTFGACNFEVATTAAGVLQTIKPIQGCFYEFYIAEEQLVATEVDVAQSDLRLQLLDVGTDEQCSPWGSELPPRVRQMHSHWLCKSRGTVLVRPHSFLAREVQYLIQLSPTKWPTSPPPDQGTRSVNSSLHPHSEPGVEAGTGSDSMTNSNSMADSTAMGASKSPQQQLACWRVPLHLQSVRWMDLCTTRKTELTEHLVILPKGSSVCEILSKMEPLELIHTYCSCFETVGSSSIQQQQQQQQQQQHQQQDVLFELPRYGMEFKLHGSQILSLDFAGFSLAPQQQLVLAQPEGQQMLHTLPGLQQYLVLEQGSGLKNILVLVPAGEVCVHKECVGGRGASGRVQVQVDTRIDAQLQFHTYQVHGRFRDLRAPSILSRLQLAALYTASSTYQPEPACRRTGIQTAMQLLRQAWKNYPLTPEESAQLQAITTLAAQAPNLQLLVAELRLSAGQLSFLYSESEVPTLVPQLDPDVNTCYLAESQPHGTGGWRGFERNPYALLTQLEEQQLLGIQCRPRSQPAWMKEMRRSGKHQVHVPPCPVPAEFVAAKEEELRSLVRVKPPRSAQPPPYPLAHSHGASPLERDMHLELEESWAAYHCLPIFDELDCLPEALSRHAADMKTAVQRQREDAEAHLLHHLSWIPEETGGHGTCFRLLRLCGGAPWAGLQDLAKSVILPPEELHKFNPFLSLASCTRLVEGSRTWMQLCVLEDRLRRINTLCKAVGDSKALLIQELMCTRTWDAAKHPEWLVLETEGQLQIRPAQHCIAQHLLHSPRAIDQLNMGEGKTRVILPMLAVSWADGSSLVRLNFLSPLLDEAYGFLHSFLTASLLNRKLFRQNFNRDVAITAPRATTMRAALARCQQVGGMLLVAPEHRMSLQLKRDEAWEKDQDTCAELDKLESLPYQDIMDENDVLLSHKYQLVYSCGTHTALPAAKERALAIQALLHTISDLSDAGGSILDQPGLAVKLGTQDARRPGAFAGLRLLPSNEPSVMEVKLCTTVAEMLLQDPPLEMGWMARQDQEGKQKLVACMVDKSTSAQDVLGHTYTIMSEDQLSHLLALRGLLAGRLLVHCLQKRHNVHFGVSRLATARKRLAVPFRAADMPSERSEWAQPDVAILLTTISYYYDGLSLQQLHDAIKLLLSMGPSAQHSYYDDWLKRSSNNMHPDHLATLNDVRKLDATNSQQLQLLHDYFSHNMLTVDFWLSFCVLPVETSQLPTRLARTAWHLADTDRIVGFSGTNDCHRLLPLQVNQANPGEQNLQGTNGKMLDIILKNQKYSTINQMHDLGGNPLPLWQCMMRQAVAEKADALIDSGALLAGVSNRAVADYVIPLLDSSRHQGVCFFEPHADPPTWVVLESRGRCLPLSSAPVKEQNTFAIFDDARCRGADLKLHQDALGIVTLGAGMTKDKLMQAAGRMRQLERGQTIQFAGSQEVTDKMIRLRGTGAFSSSGSGDSSNPQPLTSHQVLQWVMVNTVDFHKEGLLEWARKGMHYVTTKAQQGLPLHEEEQYELEALYADARMVKPIEEEIHTLVQLKVLKPSPRPLAQTAQAQTTQHQQHQQQALEHLPGILNMICKRGSMLGHGHTVVTSRHGTDDQCERELQKEEEEQEEHEHEVPCAQPQAEQAWLYSAALTATSAIKISTYTEIMPLPSVVRAHLPPNSQLQPIRWSEQVLCTANFVRSITMAESQVIHEYLRPLGMILIFPVDGTVLLVSEREADALLLLEWEGASSRGHQQALRPILQPFCYARLSYYSHGRMQFLTAQEAAPSACLRTTIADLQLFNGDTSYGDGRSSSSSSSKEARLLLRGLVYGKREAAEEIVCIRGKMPMFPRSDLEWESRVE